MDGIFDHFVKSFVYLFEVRFLFLVINWIVILWILIFGVRLVNEFVDDIFKDRIYFGVLFTENGFFLYAAFSWEVLESILLKLSKFSHKQNYILTENVFVQNRRTVCFIQQFYSFIMTKFCCSHQRRLAIIIESC